MSRLPVIFFGHGSPMIALETNDTTRTWKAMGDAVGKPKAIVRGLVRVEKDAPGCSGFQREETLLLSEDAEIDAVPNLEIENQDVKCGHAASIGRLDKEKLFYLMSRGLDRAAAERLLIDAFIEPFLAAVTDDALRASLAETIAAKLA